MELQGKKEKLSRLEDNRCHKSSGRQPSVSAAYNPLCRLREDSTGNAEASVAPFVAPSPNARRRRLAQVRDGNVSATLCRSLQMLLALR